MNEFSREIQELGPLGSSEGIDEAELKSRLEEMAKLIPYFKLAKMKELALHDHDETAYAKLFTTEEVERLIREAPTYYIDPEKCQACMTCARKCPVDAILSAKGQVHIIDQDKCIKCGTCLAACPPKFGAVTKLIGQSAPPPLPEGQRAVVRTSKEATA